MLVRSVPQPMTGMSARADSFFAPAFRRRAQDTHVPSTGFLCLISIEIPSEPSRQEEGYVSR